MSTTVRVAAVLLATVTLSAADAAYIGKWKLNIPQSDFGQVTVTYEAQPDGGVKVTTDNQSYTFKTDSKDVPTPWGTTASWKSVNPRTWEMTQKTNGKVISTDTIIVSDDDKRMTVDSKVMSATGAPYTNNMTFERQSGGPGLAGTWKTSKMSTTSPAVVEISKNGDDGLTLKFPNEGGVCTAKFDSKDVAAHGTMWPNGWTCALTKKGDNGFDVAWKKDGKAMYQSSFTASGNTLTETGGAANSSEKIKAVYDKQ
jgi:hypothetical protein